jgi:hypothetical protein
MRHEELVAAFTQALQQTIVPLDEKMTAQISQLVSNQLNGVIRTETLILDAAGQAYRRSTVPIASITAWAYGGDITLEAASPQSGAAPTNGIGLLPIPAGQLATLPLAGDQVTVYGTAGQRVLLVLWAIPQAPHVGGQGPVNGGGA